MSPTPPEISAVIPARDEVMALDGLLTEVADTLSGEAFGIVVIDDGSTDGSDYLLRRLAARDPHLRWLRNDTAIGQSASIRRGVRLARGALIVTLDGDGQNPPDQIPALLAPFRQSGDPGFGLVEGQRERRQDTAAKRFASRIANAIRGAFLQDGVRDPGAGSRRSAAKPISNFRGSTTSTASCRR